MKNPRSDYGTTCGGCQGTGYQRKAPCQVCGGRGRLLSVMPEYEREQIADVLKNALDDGVQMTIQLTRAVF